MTKGKLQAIVYQLRPGLVKLEGPQRIQAYVEVTSVLFMTPFVGGALIWLITATNLPEIRHHFISFLFLFLLIFMIQRRPFNVNLKLGGDRSIPLVGSLSNLALWVAMLVFGMNALWLIVFVHTGNSFWEGWQRNRANQDQFWGPFSLFMQEVGGGVLAGLVALTLYTALGGIFPLSGRTVADWLPALCAMFVQASAPGIILLPIVMQFNRLLGVGNTLGSIFGFLGSVTLLTLLIVPFAILASLLYAQAGNGLLLFFMIGVLLVNLLAYYLSCANENSQQRTRELARLEALGEAIIQAPADASTLHELLATHVSKMFPRDMVEIRIGAPHGSDTEAALALGFTWPTFRLSCPANQFPADDSVWDKLFQIDNSYFIQHNVILSGAKAAYGDAVVVKVMVATPQVADPEQKQADSICVGGICMLRHRMAGKAVDSLAAMQSLASQIGSAVYRAQVYAKLLAEYLERERRLKATVDRLRIEIDAQRKQTQIDAVTETDYFKYLEVNAEQLRDDLKGINDT